MVDEQTIVGSLSATAVAAPPGRPVHEATRAAVALADSDPRALRVTYDHTIFTAQAHGGISRYFCEIIPRIAAKEGVSVSAYMGSFVTRYGLERHRGSFAHFAGRRRPDWPRTGGVASRLGNRRFPRFLAASAADVYHATHNTVLAPHARVARVLTVHDCIHERMMRRRDPVVQAAVEAAEGLICVSERTRADVMDVYGVPERKTRVVYHGDSLRDVAPGPPPAAGPYILYVGARYVYKNFRGLLLAYGTSARLRDDFRLVCFGGGPLTPDEWHAVTAFGIESRVHVVPAGDDAALAGAYAHAAALVYPSLYEGFGMPLLEAMGQGCPVVCSKTSCLPEVAGGAAVLFDPQNTGELAAKLEATVYDSGERARLRAAGLARERTFTWERAAAETLDFYRAVAGK
jgi:glycosyltransferase involved in cell wall biosynthesis